MLNRPSERSRAPPAMASGTAATASVPHSSTFARARSSAEADSRTATTQTTTSIAQASIASIASARSASIQTAAERSRLTTQMPHSSAPSACTACRSAGWRRTISRSRGKLRARCTSAGGTQPLPIAPRIWSSSEAPPHKAVIDASETLALSIRKGVAAGAVEPQRIARAVPRSAAASRPAAARRPARRVRSSARSASTSHATSSPRETSTRTAAGALAAIRRSSAAASPCRTSPADSTASTRS